MAQFLNKIDTFFHVPEVGYFSELVERSLGAYRAQWGDHLVRGIRRGSMMIVTSCVCERIAMFHHSDSKWICEQSDQRQSSVRASAKAPDMHPSAPKV